MNKYLEYLSYVIAAVVIAFKDYAHISAPITCVVVAMGAYLWLK